MADGSQVGAHGENFRAVAAARFERGLDGFHLRGQLGDLILLFANQSLLFLSRLDEQRGKAAVIDALGVLAVLVPGDNLGDDRPNFFGNYSDFVLAVRLQLIGDATELLDLS